MLVVVLLLGCALFPAAAQAPGQPAPTTEIDRLDAEVDRLEKDFLKAQYADLSFYFSMSLALLGLAFSLAAFLGWRSIANARASIEAKKKEVEKLERDAEEHLKRIESVREEADGWRTEMETAADDIAALKEQLSELQAGVVAANPELRIGPAEMDEEAARRRMLKALTTGQYKWRSLDRVASIGGVGSDQAAQILRPLTEEVVFSRGKSGRTIVGLKSRVR